MDKSQIKNYLLEHKDSYDFESLKKQLINSGASESDINSVALEIGVSTNKNQSTQQSNSKSSNGVLFLVLAILSFFIPIIGFIIHIVLIFKCSKIRKTNKNDGVILASLIISWIGIVLGIFSLILLFLMFGSIFYATSFEEKLIEDIETQTYSHSAIEVSRVQDGLIFLKNLNDNVFVGDSFLVSSDSGYLCEALNFEVPAKSVEGIRCESNGLAQPGDLVSVNIVSKSGILESAQILR